VRLRKVNQRPDFLLLRGIDMTAEQRIDQRRFSDA
jgi:hypothetical protein